MAPPFSLRRFIPGYDPLAPKQTKTCVDGILAWDKLARCRQHFETMQRAELPGGLDKPSQTFLKKNALKVLEPIWAWQGRASAKTWIPLSLYLAALPIILCVELGMFRELTFELRSVNYYFNYLCMVVAYSIPVHAMVGGFNSRRLPTTPSSLARLRRDFALTMEFPALGYFLAQFVPPLRFLYGNWWYSVILAALTTASIYFNRFKPVHDQDKLNAAHRHRKEVASASRPIRGTSPGDAELQAEPVRTYIGILDDIEPAIREFKERFRDRPGHSGYNTQITLLLEGWDNVIIRLYDVLPANIRNHRLANMYPMEEVHDQALGKAKFYFTWAYFPFGIANVVPLAVGRQWGSLAQSIIAVIDVGSTLIYRARSDSYGIPAFLDHYNAMFIFAFAGLPVAFIPLTSPTIFIENKILFWGMFAYMFAMTFIICPAAVHYAGGFMKRRFDRARPSERTELRPSFMAPVAGRSSSVAMSVEAPTEVNLRNRRPLPVSVPGISVEGHGGTEYWWNQPREIITGWMNEAETMLLRPPTPNVAAGQAKNPEGDALSRRDVEVQTFFFTRAREMDPRITFIGEENLNLEGCLTEFPDRMWNVYYMVVDPTDGTANWLRNKGGRFATTLMLQKGTRPFFAIVNLPLQKRLISIEENGVLENGEELMASFRPFEEGKLSIAYGTGKKIGPKAKTAFLGHLRKLETEVKLIRPSCLTESVMAVADGKVHAYVTGKERATNSNAVVYLAEKLGMEVRFYRSGPNSNEDQRMIFASPGFIEKYVPEDGWLAGFLAKPEYKEADY